MKVSIKKAGLFSIVQDTGRTGFQEFGVPRGGALDRRAAKTANWLVGQPDEAPVLEITLHGPKLQFEGPVQIALTGADLSPTINGEATKMYETLQLNAGDVLAFGGCRSGCRTYLAFGGDLLLEEWLGSYSGLKVGSEVVPKSAQIKKGNYLNIQPNAMISLRSLPLKQRPHHSRHLTVRVMPGPEFGYFSTKAIDFFSSYAFRLSSDCNRMGYRLGKKLTRL